MRIAGLGFRKGVSAESLHAALALIGPFDALATVAAKAQEPGLQRLVSDLGLPFHAVSQQELAASETRGTGLARLFYGTGSVAESAALAAAGPGSVLVTSKRKTPDGMAVVAVAETI
jgi:cobalt-precorrin 5A hydrolase